MDFFATKMRSVIKTDNSQGIKDVVAQQFEIGKRIIARGLAPIIEPEVDINSPQKAGAEKILRDELLANLATLSEGQNVIFKLTLPEQSNFYHSCMEHDNVLKVAALSGGYSREEANRRLSENTGMIASFSRALTEGLSARQFRCQVQSHPGKFYRYYCSRIPDLIIFSIPGVNHLPEGKVSL